MQGGIPEFLPIASGEIRPDMNRIDIGIRELEMQVKADPSLILDKDLGIKRDRFDHDVSSPLTIFNRTNSSPREGFL